MPQPPALTPEQRLAALEKAAEARRIRADIKEQLKDERITLTQLFERAGGDEVVAKLKVVSMLESMPNTGKVKARRLMRDLDISERRRVRGLGPNQRQKLLEHFGPKPLSVLLVVAGPSGVGKGTIVRELLARDPRLWFSVSITDRAPRPGEVDGRDYRFVDRDEFCAVRDAGGLLEWFEVYGDLKGTPRAPIEERLAAGQDVLLEVDVQGAMAVRDVFPDALLVFVRPPSRAVQRARLVARDPDADAAQIETRLAAAEREEELASAFDAVVVNDDVGRAVEEILGVLAVRRTRGA